jgi:hypothetical protein
MAFDFACNNAQSTREICASSYKTEAALQATVTAALYAAMAAQNTFSTTVSVTGATSQDLQNVTRILGDMNFTTSQSGSTLTISW